jgi:DNA-binding MarR family transcriptional regulator
MSDLRDKAKLVSLSCACTRVRQVSRAVSQFYDRLMKDAELTQSQFTVLVAATIGGEHGIPISRCAKILVLDRTSLTRVLKPMEAAKLVRLQASATDARAKLVQITPKGTERLGRALKLWEQAQAAFERSVGAEAWVSLNRSLGHVLVQLDAEHAAV